MLKDRENLIKAYAELHWNEPFSKYQVQYCSFSSSHYNKIICLTDINHYTTCKEIWTTKTFWEQLNVHEYFWDVM
jgi:hypothetical protein